ncbi:MAG: type IX secretion system protein PorQ [Paludibacter sp.]|nr:type IX secretion system protein PorQ [Paludibacter sp.]
MFKKHILVISLILFYNQLFSQAGKGVYQFLELPVSSRLAALGGTNVSNNDNDINFAFQNPALLTTETSNVIGLNMANYLADIQFGSAMYALNLDKKNFFAIGIQYVDFGIFKETNEFNEVLGEFTAKDMAINIIYARPLTDKITIGGTLKPIYSAYERYSSFGIALDAGISYNDPLHLFSAGLVVKNIGTQLKGYYSDENGQHYESLPLNIQLGITKKLAHAPFRFSLNLHNLQRWDLNYLLANQSGIKTAATRQSNISFIDMAFRHSVIGVEFVPNKSFYIAASYNHRRHQELSMNGFKSLAGFSVGGGIKLYKFQVGFGMSQYQVGNYAYQFSLSTGLNEFRL